MKFTTVNSTTATGTFPIYTDSSIPQGTGYVINIPPMKIDWEPKGPVPYIPEEKESMKERTFVMIKPDAFERGLVGEILDLVSQRGVRIVAFKTVQLTPADCEKHYAHHVGKDFYPKLVEFMTSGPSLAIVFEGDEAASVCRQLIGNSKHPSQVPPGSIRGRYALDFPRNLIHGSDSYEDARRELRIYLNEDDIYDEPRIKALRSVYEEKKAAAQREYERKLTEGIKLGEEAFAPEVLQEGDWLVSRKGMSLIRKVEFVDTGFLDDDSKPYMAIIHEDYFNGWWGRKGTTTTSAGTSKSSMEFTWATSPLFLVGRDGQFLSNFVSPQIQKEDGKRYVFKEGRWLPIFAKKSKPPKLNYIDDIPFANILEDHSGILSDVFDPKNQQVMRIFSKDIDTKWRIMLGGTGADMTPPGAQGLSETQAIMRLRKQAQVAPGKLSVLLRYGRPYAASYGEGMKWFNLATGEEYPKPPKKKGYPVHPYKKKYPPSYYAKKKKLVK